MEASDSGRDVTQSVWDIARMFLAYSTKENTIVLILESISKQIKSPQEGILKLTEDLLRSNFSRIQTE